MYMNCLYDLENSYAFKGNTSAFVQMEDGNNEFGLAVGLTFIYPLAVKPGFNAGRLVRYILQKYRTTKEALKALKKPSHCLLADTSDCQSFWNMAVVECNGEHIESIYLKETQPYVAAVNEFYSECMKPFNKDEIDNWKAGQRYQSASSVLNKNKNNYSIEVVRDILKGKYGFLCQYERKKKQDTVWSVIYDLKKQKDLALGR